ncbi:hypothetical protein RHMOL_Rhmol13G0281800 [Rhododendron molle]|uniref:Uncharacterized protein n=1 Tax=Rhododendron molle TaxID=49168 RepID=A0ACC0LBZ7_RHOML|nr:hypothetical protein RHMOL_Rhmol13G0281800 [Rhododendron molle]
MRKVHRTVGKEEEEAGAENWFQRLPDDVVLQIFGKLSDVKWLCRCFVVAKRFSSLIPLVQIVSFVTKTWNSVFSIEDGDLRGTIFLGKFSEFLTNNFKLARLHSPRLNFNNVVFHLKQIESLNIELPSDFNADNDSVFKWGANFTTNILESFTFLYAASLSKTDEEKDRKETENEIAQDELVRRVNLALDCFQNAVLRSQILSCAVRTCSMLQSITFTDSKNKGVKLCLAGEKLVQFRYTLEVSPTISSENFELWALKNMRGGYVPVLQLPISGYVMKGVTIVDFNMFAFDDTSMLDAFAEEKGVFSEAVVQILEKHKGGQPRFRLWRSKTIFEWIEQIYGKNKSIANEFPVDLGAIREGKPVNPVSYRSLHSLSDATYCCSAEREGEMSSVREEASENQFHRLPDDVVVSIFENVSDIECLCRCFLVSKRFSSLILRVQTVSIKGVTLDCKSSKSGKETQTINPLGNGLLGKFSNLVLKPLRYLHKLALSPPPRLQFNIPGLAFLALLKQVRSLNLEVISDFDADNDCVFKWGADFTARHPSVTFLFANSLSKMTTELQEEEEEEEEEEVGSQNTITREELLPRASLAFECIEGASRWLGILSHVVTKYPMLQNLTISDSMNKGVKLRLGGGKLVECRNAFDLDKVVSLSDNWTPDYMRVGFVPVLRLPMSGYVMKVVTIFNFRMSAADDSEAYSAMLDAFAEEQGVFLEALVQILEKHKGSIMMRT